MKISPTPCEGSLLSHTSAEHVDIQENSALPMNGIWPPEGRDVLLITFQSEEGMGSSLAETRLKLFPYHLEFTPPVTQECKSCLRGEGQISSIWLALKLHAATAFWVSLEPGHRCTFNRMKWERKAGHLNDLDLLVNEPPLGRKKPEGKHLKKKNEGVCSLPCIIMMEHLLVLRSL